MNISIDASLREACPQAALGILRYCGKVEKSGAAFIRRFEQSMEALCARYETADIAKMPHVASTRKAYQALGKDPHSYRNAAEAMLRRILKGKGLYYINNAVDINNLLSVTSGYSLGSYDAEKLQGEIVLRRAAQGEHYLGIGKDSYNVEYLPTLHDAQGAFGNPSSDSQRSMVLPGQREVLLVCYSFDGGEGLPALLDAGEELLGTYCPGFECLERRIVEE